jgi:membrane protein DedA with SNARE-associated domain
MLRRTVDIKFMFKSWQTVILISSIFFMASQPVMAVAPFISTELIRSEILSKSESLGRSMLLEPAKITNTNVAGDLFGPSMASFDPLSYLSKQNEPLTGRDLAWTLLLIALATLISEDLACISAGLIAARGIIGLFPAITASFLGILIGDILLYLAGRYIGQPALTRAPLKWVIKEEDASRAARWFSTKGPTIIISSRFLPGSRLPTYFSAGMLGTGFWRFTIYFSIAAALWTPILVGLSSLVGNRMFIFYDTFRSYGILIVVATILLIWLSLKLVVPLFSRQGRRRLLSFYRRLTR